MIKLKDAYENVKKKAGEIKQDVEKRGGEKVAQDYFNRGKKSAAKVAFTATKVATSNTAKAVGKTAVCTATGTKSIVAAKIGKWLDDNYHVVIEHSGLGDREKKGAKYGIITAHLLGKARDSITKRLQAARAGLEEKKKQFTLEEAIPEFYVAVGLVDKFSAEEGTIENRNYKMGDGIEYTIEKHPGKFELTTKNPNGRGLEISYYMINKGDVDSLRQEMQVLLNDLVSRVEEYADPSLVSSGETTRQVQVSSDKFYSSTFSKDDHTLQFQYFLREGGMFSKKCSHVSFRGYGIKTQEVKNE